MAMSRLQADAKAGLHQHADSVLHCGHSISLFCRRHAVAGFLAQRLGTGSEERFALRQQSDAQASGRHALL